MKQFKSSRHTPQATDTLIGKGTVIEGTLSGESNIRIEGSFIGVIESQGSVIVGESALARCHIHAKEVIIAGQVYGDIHADQKLTITSTGQLTGDVLSASALIIAEGAILHGASLMHTRARDTSSEESSVVVEPSYLRPEAG
ncbi:bactofilin family protein [Paenibacillus pini]|uniref:Integral membrane protein CcmA n=1 Tax=Paenibacillus pini JCM 16418 TaxID=1236976 RepID=W7YK94_9BACL|nr:polymer-forming cytoskeletal protein [Paenibacillus pini]GAF08088.1 hypothetical protein JCM16418_2126 [Paenibacillus pini JCM 16418]